MDLVVHTEVVSHTTPIHLLASGVNLDMATSNLLRCAKGAATEKLDVDVGASYLTENLYALDESEQI
jgi:hypothetical protein